MFVWMKDDGFVVQLSCKVLSRSIHIQIFHSFLGSLYHAEAGDVFPYRLTG